MKALCFRGVKLTGHVGEPKLKVGGSENTGYSADGFLEDRIVVRHEWSPLEITHNDFRFAVEALSGGLR